MQTIKTKDLGKVEAFLEESRSRILQVLAAIEANFQNLNESIVWEYEYGDLDGRIFINVGNEKDPKMTIFCITPEGNLRAHYNLSKFKFPLKMEIWGLTDMGKIDEILYNFVECFNEDDPSKPNHDWDKLGDGSDSKVYN